MLGEGDVIAKTQKLKPSMIANVDDKIINDLSLSNLTFNRNPKPSMIAKVDNKIES